MPTGSPLLDDYDRTGIVTPGLQRALDATKAKLGQPFQLQRPTQSGPTLAPPGPNVPTLARPQETAGITEAPSAPAFSPTPSPISLATPQRASLTQNPLMEHLQSEHERLTDPTLQSSKPGVDQIQNPWLRTPLKVLEAIGTGFAPRLTAAIPGTSLHHRGLVQTNEAQQEQMEKQATEEANREHLGAETANAGASAAKTQAETPEIAPNAAANREHLGAETTNLGAQTEHTNAETDALKTAGAFQHVLDPETGDLVALTKDPKTGKVSAEVVYKGNPKVETDMTEANGRRVLVNKKTGEVLKDLGAAKTASANDHGVTVVDDNGQVVRLTPGMTAPSTFRTPQQAGSLNTPTTQMRNVAAQASLVHEQTPMMLSEIDRMKDKLGPMAGRWNEFMQGKVGMNDPDFAGLRADLLMYSSAVALMHARGRLPENLREEFDTAINNPGQSFANLKSVISRIDDWTSKNMSAMGGKQPDAKSDQLPGGVSLDDINAELERRKKGKK